MNSKLMLCLALVLSGGLTAYGSSTDFPVTPTCLDQRQFVFSISTNSTQEGISFHVTITAKTGLIASDSSVEFCSIITSTQGARSMGPAKHEPQVTLQKDNHIWKADFIASDEFLKSPDVYFVFSAIAHVNENGKTVPMSSADLYEIKLRDFLKP
jgi:hypothetical protein